MAPGLANAQVLYGSLVGNATDQNGAVVAGATVTVTDKSTGLSRETASREDGDYAITNILPGAYELKLTKQGFTPFSKTDMVITANNVTRAD